MLLLCCHHNFPEKHTQICVAIMLKELRSCSWCFFFTSIIIFLQSIHRSVLPSSSNISGAAAGASSSLSSSFPCKAHTGLLSSSSACKPHTDLCCRHPQRIQGLQLVLLLYCHHHCPTKRNCLEAWCIDSVLRKGSYKADFTYQQAVLCICLAHTSILYCLRGRN